MPLAGNPCSYCMKRRSMERAQDGGAELEPPKARTCESSGYPRSGSSPDPGGRDSKGGGYCEGQRTGGHQACGQAMPGPCSAGRSTPICRNIRLHGRGRLPRGAVARCADRWSRFGAGPGGLVPARGQLQRRRPGDDRSDGAQPPAPFRPSVGGQKARAVPVASAGRRDGGLPTGGPGEGPRLPSPRLQGRLAGRRCGSPFAGYVPWKPRKGGALHWEGGRTEENGADQPGGGRPSRPAGGSLCWPGVFSNDRAAGFAMRRRREGWAS